MCGIVGLWFRDDARPDRVEFDRFTDALAHRGPDGRGVFHDKDSGVAFGHRRLAILDLSEAGKQPMSYAAGRYWITYNGEIYNFLELRETLEGLGHVFHTQTDTEVILAAYAQWGAECQIKFNGMWAFAIWDRDRRELFLSRDRFGVKPLFYYWDGRRFAFASELKAFVALSWFDVAFDPETVALAVKTPWNVEGTEYSLLKGIRRLPGGYCIRLDAKNEPRIHRWWNTLDHLVTPPAKYQDQVAEYRRLFFDACRIRMRSDVPLGTSLSGGLDSSSVLCAMVAVRRKAPAGPRMATNWQNAFIASYPGTEQDETAYALEVARATGAKTFVFEMRPEQMLEALDDIVFQYEEISDVPLGPWEMYRQERANGIVVSIDGHGGDEALAGYWYHIRDAALRDALWPWPHPIGFVVLYSTLRNMYRPNALRRVPTIPNILKQHWIEPAWEKLRRISWNHLLGELKKGKTGTNTQPHSSGWLRVTPRTPRFPAYDEDSPRIRGRSELFRALYRDFHAVSLPMNLHTYDRLSMAHGVEVRAPFCDWRLVTYTFSLPDRAWVHGGFTKRILRDAMVGLLPEWIRLRRLKLGFASPLASWLQGILRPFFMDSLRSSSFLQSPIWVGPNVAAAAERAYARGDGDLLAGIWSYVLADRLMDSFRHKAREWRE